HYGKVGLDTNGTNWGSDIYKAYTTREKDYNNNTGQGLEASLTYVLLRAAWLINVESGFKVEAGLQLRQMNAGLDETANTRSLPLGGSNMVFVGLRTEFLNRYFDF
ncbi:MAG: hypothetical protein ACPF9D_13615, partial [Owenweeksia sp.]